MLTTQKGKDVLGCSVEQTRIEYCQLGTLSPECMVTTQIKATLEIDKVMNQNISTEIQMG